MSTQRSHQIRATLTPHTIMNHRSIHEKQPLLIRHVLRTTILTPHTPPTTRLPTPITTIRKLRLHNTHHQHKKSDKQTNPQKGGISLSRTRSCTGVQGVSPVGVGGFFTMESRFLWFVVGI
nr:MAG TPA: hypothetical protein [Caudoviricetes sp.]